jgi:hypothetical protein
MFAYNPDFARQAFTDEVMLVYRVDEGTVKLVTYTYPESRRALNNLLAKLHGSNTDRFTSQEEVFPLFTRAYFTGKILPIERLVDRTFRKGTFRQLGEPQPIDALSAYIDAL